MHTKFLTLQHSTFLKLSKLLILTASISLAGNVHAWSGYGHRGIAKLAWSQITPEARELTFKILTSGIDLPETTDCGEQTMMASSTATNWNALVGSVSYMDCVRGPNHYNPRPYSALVHADRRTLCSDPLPPNLYCPSNKCTSNALVQAIKDLNNPWVTVKTRRMALKIVLHFLEDLHQPDHAAHPGRIHYLVKVDGQTEPMEFHGYWDGVVPQLVLSDKVEADKVKALMLKEGENFKKGTVEDWVKESANRSLKAFNDLVGENNRCVAQKTPIPITPEYEEQARIIGREAIAAAAVRLAYVLNNAAKQLAPYKDYIDRSIAMSKLLKDTGTSEERARETERILKTAGIDPTQVKPIEEDHDLLEDTNDILIPTQGLFPGQSLLSENNQYEFIMQLDNNLVLYKLISPTEKHPLWASRTMGSGAVEAAFQTDGNFVLYTKAHKPVWATMTLAYPNKRPAAKAIMQNDGNFVLYDKDGKQVWATNTPQK
ncbi:MAG: S1/P1 nuclease [Pseudomonadota bacterium]